MNLGKKIDITVMGVAMAIVGVASVTLLLGGFIVFKKQQKAAMKAAVVQKKTPKTQKPKAKPKPTPAIDSTYILAGTLTDTQGRPMKDVVVSDGYSCTLTNDSGAYTLRRDEDARFVYYTVPAYCAVPVHSKTDHTACFYQQLSKNKHRYNFTLALLKGGAEKNFRLIVFGDPQVTNAMNPYYEGPNDNPIEKSDLARFTDETMTDVKATLAAMPAGDPVYGLSMGDDVQYYGGYNAALERGIRRSLGSSRMAVFSVIGNHDQDGKAVYKHQWEDSWGPTDYSFDRGDVHFVCLNDVLFYRGASYYSPGELTAKQLHWLRSDLLLADKKKKVVLCYHIPLTFGNAPFGEATPLNIASEAGHYASAQLGKILTMLNEFRGGFELFCGHTHFALNHEIDFRGQRLLERCHAAACGMIWQSNVNICGTPNGYYVYTFKGEEISNCYYKGTSWDAKKQMSLFSADTDFNGEEYTTDWNLPRGKGVIVANVFNADSHWRVYALENGQRTPMKRLNSLGQDAFSAGYHHKYMKCTSFRFVSKQNSYLIMNHLYYYEPRDKNATITIHAYDEYGNRYEAKSSEIVKEPFFNYAHYIVRS